MADPRDKNFLQLCLDKRLLDQELADRAGARAHHEGRRVTEVLVELGVMAQHTVEAIEREVERALEPRTIAGFRLIRKLGQGGMGTVYLAVQVSLQREVALKIIAPQIAADREAAERFVREARIAAAVNHPNIIGIIDAGEDGGQLFMALELITGGDASQLAARFNGVLPEARALEVIVDCCHGLQALYEARLIHRDIKPANIFITGDGAAKLADLGLARREGGDDRLTVSGFAIGTPAYMSPEQANGDPGIDIRSDIYALGATLFALATGSQPFTGNGPFAIAAKVLTQPVPDPRALNPAITAATAAVILRAMAKRPEQRYQTPNELRQALEEAAAGIASAPIPHPGAALATAAPASATAATMMLPEPAAPLVRGRIHSSPRTQRSMPRPARRRLPTVPVVLAALAVLAVLSVPLLFNRHVGQPPAPAPLPPPAVVSHQAPPAAAHAPAVEVAVPPAVARQDPPVIEVAVPPAVARQDPVPVAAPDERATRPPATPPEWATASGLDGYGAWADLRIGAVTQRLRWIDPGTFLAGSPPTEAGHVAQEDQLTATISSGFWLADSECTQGLWLELMGSNPSVNAGDPRLPVENMLFEEAEGFLQRLSQHTAGSLARMPTRCEFEYAERAGSTTAYFIGDDAALLAPYANILNKGPGRPLPVRSLKPNRWGLYDMIGNVTEWTYGGVVQLSSLPGLDPELANRSTINAYHIRGGSYQHTANGCRAAAYGYMRRDSRGGDLGFRFLVEQQAKPEHQRREVAAGNPPAAAPAQGAHSAKPPARPPWAAAIGKDAFGSWADLRIGVETQRLRWIEPGSFVMGSPPTEKGRGEWEDQRPVTISHGFWMADSSCTQEVWKTVIGSNPSLHTGAAQLPVQRVSFDDALGFLDKLSQRSNGCLARLPTRAEWEYAARAGVTTSYLSGDDPALTAPYGNSKDYGPGHPIPVRSLKPNHWGLYDVMGNIQQWVYGGVGAEPVGAAIDPELANRAALIVFHIRGGSCDQPVVRCRLAGGGILPRDCRNNDLGFRFLIEQAVRGTP